MASDQHKLKSIFDEAAEIASPEDRDAYLERACGGDAGLRRNVDALLQAFDRAGSFLEASPALEMLNVTGGAIDPAIPETDPAWTAAAAGDSVEPGPSGPTRSLLPSWPLLEGPGSVIGPFKLLQKIGEGGMGAVFMAEQEKPVRRKVALKLIKPGMDTGQVIARFEAERQALAIMDHPNIARVLDVGTTEPNPKSEIQNPKNEAGPTPVASDLEFRASDFEFPASDFEFRASDFSQGRPYFVMELVKGVPITEYCDRNHLTPNERLELFIPVCQAIQHAHQKGIIHRDIKPSNVLVTLHDGTPTPKVIDFGVAKAIDQRLTERTMFTEFGQVIGTLEYMSPEQAEMGALDIDTRSDIYSLGVMLYELLTGSTPLERTKLRQATYAEILKRIREEEPTKPSTRLSDSKDALPSISAQRKMEPARLTKLVRGDLDWIVMKCLEKDRTRRYETANGFAKDIRRYLDGDAVEASPPSATYKLRKFARKHRTALATVSAFAMLLVSATAISLALALWANRERTRAENREKLAIEAVKRFRDAVVNEPALKNTDALEDLRKRLLKEPLDFFRALRDRLQVDRDTRPESLARLANACLELGQLTGEIGDKQDAVTAYKESLAILQQLADSNPTITSFQESLAAYHLNVGPLLTVTGNRAEAMKGYERALAIFQKLADANPTVTTYQHGLAGCQHSIANLLFESGKPAEALLAFERALVIQQKLARSNPTDTDLQDNLARRHHNIGHLLSTTGKPAEAMSAYERALVIQQKLADANPTLTSFQRSLAYSFHSIGVLLSDTGKAAEAMKAYERALDIQQKLADSHPTVTDFQDNLARTHHSIGNVPSDTGNHGRGAEVVREGAAYPAEAGRLEPHRHQVPD